MLTDDEVQQLTAWLMDRARALRSAAVALDDGAVELRRRERGGVLECVERAEANLGCKLIDNHERASLAEATGRTCLIKLEA